MTEEELEKLSMEAKLLLAGGKYWEKKGKRIYLSDIVNKIFDIEVKRYHTGNISEIYIDTILQKLNDLDFIEFDLSSKTEQIIFKTDNILNILFYPRYCYYINNKYGPNCLKFFEYLLEHGSYKDNMDKFNKPKKRK